MKKLKLVSISVFFLFITIGSSFAAVKIDDASDFGALVGAGRQLVRTSGGVLYAVLNDGGDVEVWRSSNGGATWSEQDSANGSTDLDSGDSVAVAIDSGDTLHIVWQDNDASGAEDLHYNTFDTSTNQFGTATEIITGVNGNDFRMVSIAIDSNDRPHVLVESYQNQNRFNYINKVGGSWNSVMFVRSKVTLDSYTTSITLAEDDIPEICFHEGVGNDTEAEQADANNPTDWTLENGVIPGASAAGKRVSDIGVDSTGATYVCAVYVVPNPDEIVINYLADDGDWETGWTGADSSGNEGFDPRMIIVDTDVYVFYENGDNDIAYDLYDGSSWEGETVLETGTYQDVKPRWSYNNFNSPNNLDYLFSDGTDVYFGTFSLGDPDADSAFFQLFY